jgi:hypothetical protein
VVHAVPAADFADWLTRTHGEGIALDANAYAQLARAPGPAQPHGFRGVAPNLFAQIVQASAPGKEN